MEADLRPYLDLEILQKGREDLLYLQGIEALLEERFDLKPFQKLEKHLSEDPEELLFIPFDLSEEDLACLPGELELSHKARGCLLGQKEGADPEVSKAPDPIPAGSVPFLRGGCRRIVGVQQALLKNFNMVAGERWVCNPSAYGVDCRIPRTVEWHRICNPLWLYLKGITYGAFNKNRRGVEGIL
jgi:hypothetical protein